MGAQLTVSQLIDDIGRGQLILPEFQRGYVWKDKQVREFLVSLYRGYPTGSFLIWKTPNPGLTRGGTTHSDGRTFELILDGQQRLTSVYALVTGEAPPFYEGERLYFNVYFNVQTEEFSYYKPTIMKNAMEWLPVTPFLKAGLGDYLKKDGPVSAETRDYLYAFFDRLQQLDAIKKYSYYLDSMGEKDMDQVVRIFNLVNSKGTRLSKSDLALSHICALWPEARQVFRTAQKDFSGQGFAFDLSFYIRVTASVATESGFYEPLYSLSVDQIKAAWVRAKPALEHALDVLRFDGFIDSASNLTSDTVLVPMVVFLSRNESRFDTDQQKKGFLHWMYAALMWGRYSGSAETKLNQDLEAIRSTDPLQQLRDNIIADSGRINVEAKDMESRTSRNSLYNMTYIVARANGATDWFNGLPLYAKLMGQSRGLESHHIFPQSKLYKSGRFDSNSSRDQQRVNEIANLAFLTKQANLKLSNREPESYLPDVSDEAMARQQVPVARALWHIDRYEDFLTERRALLASAINVFMNDLLAEESVRPFTIDDYIAAGESERLEFKSSLRWDFNEQRTNKALEKSVTKTVAAFMNSVGGTLIVGVSDTGEALGIGFDMATFGQRQDRDGWEQTLRNALNTQLSKEVAALVDISFTEYQQKTVAVVHANPARRPVYLTDGHLAEFYVRSGNSTLALNVKQALDYSRDHFAEFS